MTAKNETIWTARVLAGVIEEGKIRQFCSAVVPRSYGYSGGHALAMTDDEADRVVQALEGRTDGGPLVTEAQADKGRAWIANYGHRLRIPEPARTGITHFRFRRAVILDETRWGMTCAPEYRAFYADGSTFTYHATAWTSRVGATFEFDYQEAA